MTTTSHPHPQFVLNRLWWVALLTGAATFIVNFITYIIAQNLLGIELLITAGPNATELIPLPVAALFMASLVPSLGAAGLLVLLSRFTKHAKLIFYIIAAIFLLISFGPLFQLPVAAGVQWTLGIMHILSAIVIVFLLTQFGRQS